MTPMTEPARALDPPAEPEGEFITYPGSPFQLFSPYQPAGDQPTAIAGLVEGIRDGLAFQTLLGVTGSGKTFTMANVIAQIGRPAIVFAPNKTLAAQLYSEFREFFPKNAVEYFVSYYDYYQPEAYVPQRDLFIEKDSAINEHIEQMRLSATKSVLERRDVVIVASVSAIYGIGLVVVVVADEVLDRVLREELAELAVELRGKSLVRREDDRRPADLGDHVGHREGLARTGDAEQRLEAQAVADALDQPLDRQRLVAGRLVGLEQLERRVGKADELAWRGRSGRCVDHGLCAGQCFGNRRHRGSLGVDP